MKYDGTETDIVLFKADTGEETVITENIDTSKYEAIGWNADNTLFAYDITTGYTPGTSCPYQFYPVTHKVRKRNIEIFVFSPLTSNIQHPTSVFSLGEYSTVMKSKPSLASYNGSDHIIYSKHFNTKSDIYVIPVERIANISNEPDIFDYETWFASQSWQVGDPISPYGDMNTTGGSEITDPALRTLYANMNLNPYKESLDSSPVIRYLYTGREMNIETNDYYYRARMMDSSIGRFGSKDNFIFLNRYNYVQNEPLYWIDPSGDVFVIPLIIFTIKVGLIALTIGGGIDLACDAPHLTNLYNSAKTSKAMYDRHPDSEFYRDQWKKDVAKFAKEFGIFGAKAESWLLGNL